MKMVNLSCAGVSLLPVFFFLWAVTRGNAGTPEIDADIAHMQTQTLWV